MNGESAERLFLMPLAELVDRLTIDQIKDVKFVEGREAVHAEMQRIQHDIDLIVREKAIKLDARILRIVIALAQLNMHIWNNKDEMEALVESDREGYLQKLKFAHQLNGVRNQLKNLLLVISGDKDAASIRSNFHTDGLTGWNLEI
jgi:hypothetical protein